MTEKGNIGCIDPDNQKDHDFQLIGNVPSMKNCMAMAPHMGPRCNPDNTEKGCRYIGYRKRSKKEFLQDLQTKKDCEGFLTYYRSLDKATREDLYRQADPSQGGNLSDFLYGYGGECATQPGFMDRVKTAMVDDQGPALDFGGECWVGGEKNKKAVFSTPNPNEACYLPIYLVPNGKDPSEPIMTQMMKQLEEEINRDKEELQKLQNKIFQKEITRNVSSQGLDPGAFPSAHSKAVQDAMNEQTMAPLRQKKEQAKKELAQKKQQALFLLQTAQAHDKLKTDAEEKKDDKSKILHKMNADINNIGWSLKESRKQNFLQDKITTALSILVVLLIILGVFIMIYYLIKLGKPSDLTSKVSRGKATSSNIITNLFPTTSNPFAPNRISNKTLSSLFT